jgi:predicted enzyme related to lactoylglutathione lyase
MPEDNKNIGKIAWHDLTVDDAEVVKDFYAKVVGWDVGGVSMGNQGEEYQDYNMNLPGTVETVAGVCHRRGSNSGLPPQWVMYVGVEDSAKSAEQCIASGGEIVEGPRDIGGATYYYLKDPAGAVLAIYS